MVRARASDDDDAMDSTLRTRAARARDARRAREGAGARARARDATRVGFRRGDDDGVGDDDVGRWSARTGARR